MHFQEKNESKNDKLKFAPGCTLAGSVFHEIKISAPVFIIQLSAIDLSMDLKFNLDQFIKPVDNHGFLMQILNKKNENPFDTLK